MTDFGRRSAEVPAFKLDARDRDGWIKLKQDVEGRFGPVDILVNKASIGPNRREIADTTFEWFDRMVATA
ncbi:SDR family oxidoreductase [Dactylosporangium sp. NPDC005572]|uniref:SDR family oxidoreductase n=1 Tax=Dactylosporangium sp. NPDC005572 TaxID=3156889 RepID=UPI0033AE0455